MGYYSNLSIDTRTCGEAAEDAKRDNHARWAAANKRMDALEAPRLAELEAENARLREALAKAEQAIERREIWLTETSAELQKYKDAH